MDDAIGCLLVIVLFFLCIFSFFSGVNVGHDSTVEHFEKLLEEKGYAEYFINEEKESEWRWKE